MDDSIKSLPNFNQLPTSINLDAMAELPILSPSSPNANSHTLMALPNELLILIAEYLSDHDITALLRTNRHLAFLLPSILTGRLEKELQAGGGPAALVQAAKSLHVPKLRLLVEVYHIDPNSIVANKTRIGQEDWVMNAGDFPLVSLFCLDHRQTPNCNDLVIKAAEILLRNGAKVDVRDSGLYTALWLSMFCRNIGATKLLLEHGASPFFMERFGGRIPLQYAVERHMPDFCKLFIGYSSNLRSCVNGSGQTLLHLAVQSTGRSFSTVVKILFEYGLQDQLSAFDYNGNCPLHTACRSSQWNNNAEERIAILLEYGADPNTRMKKPIISHRRFEAACLRQYQSQDLEGYTPLHLIAKGDPRGPIPSRIIHRLVEKGANIHATIPHIDASHSLTTPLSLVTQELFRFILAHRHHESLAPEIPVIGNRDLSIESRVESRIDVMATFLELGADMEPAQKILQTWFPRPAAQPYYGDGARTQASITDTMAALNAAVKLARERVLEKHDMNH